MRAEPFEICADSIEHVVVMIQKCVRLRSDQEK